MDTKDLMEKTMQELAEDLSSGDSINRLASKFGEMLDRLSPDSEFRAALINEATKRTKSTAQQPTKVNTQIKLSEGDLDESEMSFLIREATSLGIRYTKKDDCIDVWAGAMRDFFYLGVDTKAKLLTCLKDSIKTARANMLRRAKLEQLLDDLHAKCDEPIIQAGLEGARKGSDEVVLYTPDTWQFFNLLCQIFTKLGGKVKHHLNNYHDFCLTYHEPSKLQQSGITTTFVLPYNLKSLSKFLDIVQIITVIYAYNNNEASEHPSETLGADFLRKRFSAHDWMSEFGPHNLTMAIGVAGQSCNGVQCLHRELRMMSMTYRLSEMVPLLNLLWQSDNGDFWYYRVPDDLVDKSSPLRQIKCEYFLV